LNKWRPEEIGQFCGTFYPKNDTLDERNSTIDTTIYKRKGNEPPF